MAKLFCSLFLTLVAGDLMAAVQQPTPGRTIIVLLADDLGVDQVGVYKHVAGEESEDVPPTPNLDALAGEGILFRNAYSNPICCPTRATILTGRFAYNQGVGSMVQPTFGAPFADDEVTLPELLRNAGSNFTSAAFGKWHLSYKWTNANAHFGKNHMVNDGGGFDYFRGNVDNLMAPTANHTHYAKRTLRRNNLRPDEPIEVEPDFIETRFSLVTQIDSVLEYLDPRNLPIAQDIFIYLAFNVPHVTYQKPPDDLHTQDDQLGEAWDRLPEVWDGKSKSDARIYYKAMVEAMDTEIGRLRRSMPRERQPNATFIFLGDNGTPNDVTVTPFIKEHAKGTPFEGGSNVPLIIAGQGVLVAPGTVSDRFVQTTDIFATVADLAGITGQRLQNALKPHPDASPNVINSHSLRPLLDPSPDNDDEWPRQHVITEQFWPHGIEGDPMETIDARDPARIEPPLPGYAGPQLGTARIKIEGEPFTIGNTSRVLVEHAQIGRSGVLRVALTRASFDPTENPGKVVGTYGSTGRKCLLGPGAQADIPSDDAFHLIELPVQIRNGEIEEVVFVLAGELSQLFCGSVSHLLFQVILFDDQTPAVTTDITNIVTVKVPPNADTKTIRDDRYKLIQVDNGGKEQFYDLQEDKWEARNLVSRGAASLTVAQRARYDLLKAQLNAEVTSGRR